MKGDCTDLSKGLIQRDSKQALDQKINLLSVYKSNTNVRSYFAKYTEISSANQADEKSNARAQQVNSQDFHKIYPKNHFLGVSIIRKTDIDRVYYEQIFEKLQKVNFAQAQLRSLKLRLKQSRAIGSMLGLAICDALGAPLEFKLCRRHGYNYNFSNFRQLQTLIEQKQIIPQFGQPGIWTDDFAMALALSYNFMLNQYKSDNPEHLRFMFHLWWYHGLVNGNRAESVGQGRNISLSMDEFAHSQKRFIQLGQGKKNNNRQKNYTNPQNQTEALIKQKLLKRVSPGKMDNNGNGSLMRLAPCAVLHFDSAEKAMQVAAQQSLTTHNGLQAQECCRLLAKIIVDMINRPKYSDWKATLLESCEQFKSSVVQVEYLAKGLPQSQDMFDKKCRDQNQPRFKEFNRNVNDRNWNWKVQKFDYSPTRFKMNMEYIGSYCMDGLAMALHCVYHTNSFKQCALKCAKMGGDCDTVGAIAGQITGAIYGVNTEMLQLYSEMPDFKEKRYEAFLVAKKLINKAKPIETDGWWPGFNWLRIGWENIRLWRYWFGKSQDAY